MVQMVSAVTGVVFPVDPDLFGCKVRINIVAAKFFRQGADTVMPAVIPVGPVRRAHQRQDRAMILTELQDLLHIIPARLRNRFCFICFYHIVGIRRRYDLCKILIPLVILCQCILRPACKVFPSERLPSVMIMEYRKYRRQRCRQTAKRCDLPVYRACLQQHELRILLAESALQHDQRIIQRLVIGPAGIARDPRLFPDLRRYRRCIGVTVPRHQDIDRILRLSQNAVGKHFLHPGFLCIVLRTEDK